MKTIRAMPAGCVECLCGMLATVVVVAMLGPGCHASGATCASVGAVPPIITVSDARTGAAICDANVVVVEPPDASYGIPPDASYWQLQAVTTLLDGDTVPADGGSTACMYAGGPLNFISDTPVTLVVSKPGYRTATATATTRLDSCTTAAPPPDQVNVLLEPE